MSFSIELDGIKYDTEEDNIDEAEILEQLKKTEKRKLKKKVVVG